MRQNYKYILEYTVVAILFIILGVLGITGANTMRAQFDEVTQQTLPANKALEDIKIAMLQIVVATNEFAFFSTGVTSKEDADRQEDAIAEAKLQYETTFHEYESLVNEFFPDESDALNEIHEAGQELLDGSDTIIELIKQDRLTDGVGEAIVTFEVSQEAFETAVNKALDNEADELAERQESVETAIQTTRTNILIATFVALAVTVFIANTSFALNTAKEAAETANRAKDEFLGMVSHELRTPLTAILGYTTLISSGDEGPVLPDQKEALDRIIVNGNKLESLLAGLLSQTRLSSNIAEVEQAEFSPEALLMYVDTALGYQASAKGLMLTSTLATDVPPVLVGDIKHLQDIVGNLVGNAIKFTEQGEINLKLYLPDKNHWAVQVTDSGIGIPAEAQERIFNPFQQVDGSVSRLRGGIGLGLAIARKLTEALGGTITLKSEVGQGSIFTVTFPYIKK